MPGLISLGGIVATPTAATTHLRAPEGHPLEMRAPRVLGAFGAFRWRELALRVDLTLELVEHCLARVGSSR
jgi:hypothetical protein